MTSSFWCSAPRSRSLVMKISRHLVYTVDMEKRIAHRRNVNQTANARRDQLGIARKQPHIEVVALDHNRRRGNRLDCDALFVIDLPQPMLDDFEGYGVGHGTGPSPIEMLPKSSISALQPCGIHTVVVSRSTLGPTIAAPAQSCENRHDRTVDKASFPEIDLPRRRRVGDGIGGIDGCRDGTGRWTRRFHPEACWAPPPSRRAAGARRARRNGVGNGFRNRAAVFRGLRSPDCCAARSTCLTSFIWPWPSTSSIR